MGKAEAVEELKTNRSKEIRDAVQTVLDVVDEWSSSEIEYFTEKLENAVSAGLNVVFNGDIPAECLAIFAKAVALGEIWTRILNAEEGTIGPDGTPSRPFWDALQQLRESVEQAAATVSRGIEPVADLLAQMKDYAHKYDQIARMYGRYDADRDRWTGPFWNVNGTPNIPLIEQEGRNPGSVVPPGFNPLADKQKQARTESLSALAKIRQKLSEAANNGKPVDKDRATVEQLLREGQFPDVIAAVKGVSEKSVRATAAQLGIVIKEREEILNEAFEQYQRDDRVRAGDSAYIDAMSATPAGQQLDDSGSGPVDDHNADPDAGESAAADQEAEPETDTEELTALTGEDLRAFVEMAVSDNPEITASGVVAQIREDGMTASPIAVGRILSAARKAASV